MTCILDHLALVPKPDMPKTTMQKSLVCRRSWFSLNPTCPLATHSSHLAWSVPLVQNDAKSCESWQNFCRYVCRGRAFDASILRVTKDSHDRKMWDKWHEWSTNETRGIKGEVWFRTEVWVSLTIDDCGEWNWIKDCDSWNTLEFIHYWQSFLVA